MSGYKVTATRWDEGWELAIDGIGVTQCRALGAAEHMVRDYLRLDGYADVDKAPVEIDIVIDGLEERVAKSRDKTIAAAKAQRDAADESRQVARQLREHGLSVADTATVLGVSKGRVSQLVG